LCIFAESKSNQMIIDFTFSATQFLLGFEFFESDEDYNYRELSIHLAFFTLTFKSL
jgi:hypothetical protein